MRKCLLRTYHGIRKALLFRTIGDRFAVILRLLLCVVLRKRRKPLRRVHAITVKNLHRSLPRLQHGAFFFRTQKQTYGQRDSACQRKCAANQRMKERRKRRTCRNQQHAQKHGRQLFRLPDGLRTPAYLFICPDLCLRRLGRQAGKIWRLLQNGSISETDGGIHPRRSEGAVGRIEATLKGHQLLFVRQRRAKRVELGTAFLLRVQRSAELCKAFASFRGLRPCDTSLQGNHTFALFFSCFDPGVELHRLCLRVLQHIKPPFALGYLALQRRDLPPAAICTLVFQISQRLFQLRIGTRPLLAGRNERAETLFQRGIGADAQSELANKGSTLKYGSLHTAKYAAAVFARQLRDRRAAVRIEGSESAKRGALCARPLDCNISPAVLQFDGALHRAAVPWAIAFFGRQVIVILSGTFGSIDAVKHRSQKCAPCGFAAFIGQHR